MKAILGAVKTLRKSWIICGLTDNYHGKSNPLLLASKWPKHWFLWILTIVYGQKRLENENHTSECFKFVQKLPYYYWRPLTHIKPVTSSNSSCRKNQYHLKDVVVNLPRTMQLGIPKVTEFSCTYNIYNLPIHGGESTRTQYWTGLISSATMKQCQNHENVICGCMCTGL